MIIVKRVGDSLSQYEHHVMNPQVDIYRHQVPDLEIWSRVY